MKLQAMDACEFLGRTQVYSAADVDALLARIREAVEAEREQVAGAIHVYPDSPIDRARNALDALLSEMNGDGRGCSSFCHPDEPCSITGDGRCGA